MNKPGDALKLSHDERAQVAAELLATLEPDIPSQQRADADWIQELERRARAAERGGGGFVDAGASPDPEPPFQ